MLMNYRGMIVWIDYYASRRGRNQRALSKFVLPFYISYRILSMPATPAKPCCDCPYLVKKTPQISDALIRPSKAKSFRRQDEFLRPAADPRQDALGGR